MTVFRPARQNPTTGAQALPETERVDGSEPQTGLLPVAETAQPGGHSGVPFWPKGATATYRAKRRPR
jgi:hypothetical protein